MQGLAGPVALAFVGLWVVFLVPQVLRQRQQLLDSCVDDRYSRWLRVVAVTSRRSVRRPSRSVRTRPSGCLGSRSAAGLLTPGRGQRLAVPSARDEGEAVDRPHAAAERRSADAVRQVARIRAGFAAAQSRRAAAARRRGLLAALLLVATSTGWAVVGFTTVPWSAGAVPTVLLVVTLVAGRLAVLSGTHNDARWRQMIDDAERQAAKARTGSVRAAVPRSSGTRRAAPRSTGVRRQAPRAATGSTRPRVDLATTALSSGPVGRAVRPSEQVTDVFDVIVAGRGETAPSVRHASGPTPVTRPPTPSTKSGPVRPAQSRPAADERARRSEPVETVERNERTDWDPVDVPPPAYTLKPSVPRPDPAPLSEQTTADEAPADPVEPAREPEPITSGSIDLDAVLERRRASGL